MSTSTWSCTGPKTVVSLRKHYAVPSVLCVDIRIDEESITSLKEVM
ncbi:MAG: hypothetical protein ACO3JL_19425 [Myxococcota bacterium]